MPAWSRILRVLFGAYVVLTAAHIAWVIHHEPFAYDAWNMAQDTHAQPITLERFFDYWGYEYTHSNPRLGQPLTYLSYKLEYFAVIATPLAYLALAAAAVILGTGRKISLRRDRDLALYAITLGFMWFALPQIGKTLFCRAYGANYLYGAAIQLWFLVPLRLDPRARGSLLACLGYLLFGVMAGACNEHTGPTLCLFMLGYAWWRQREQPMVPSLAWAGALGAIAGFCAIFFAPGQGQRYDGLAQKVTLTGRLLARGLSGNLAIFRDLVAAAAPLLALMVLVAAVGMVREAGYAEQRTRRTAALKLVVAAMIAATLVTMTLFVSPKLGPRFFLISMMLMLAAFVALADAVLVSAEGFAPFVALAVAAWLYAAAHTVPLYDRLAVQSADRLALLEAAPRGKRLTVPAFEQVEDDWWFLGDDFKAPNKREMIATYFDLASVVLRGYDPTAPLGISDARLVASEPGIELDTFRGLDLASIHKAIHAAARGSAFEVTVELVGDRPNLPRPKLLVGRWAPDRFEGWAAKLERKGRSTTRTIAVPKDMPALDIYIYLVGGEAKPLAKPYEYVPWQTGVYWALGCRAEECFVIAAARQGG